MCGRLAFFEPQQLKDRYGLKAVPIIEVNYNFSPGMIGPVIVQNSPNRLEMMTWGMGRYQQINSRAENLPSTAGRCLVPANGFYEWKKMGSSKQPYYIHSLKEQIISFAGLYANYCFSIITTTPNQLMATIHHRMPAILSREDENNWLKFSRLRHSYERNDLEAYPVGKMVNKPGSNSEELIKRASATEAML